MPSFNFGGLGKSEDPYFPNSKSDKSEFLCFWSWFSKGCQNQTVGSPNLFFYKLSLMVYFFNTWKFEHWLKNFQVFGSITFPFRGVWSAHPKVNVFSPFSKSRYWEGTHFFSWVDDGQGNTNNVITIESKLTVFLRQKRIAALHQTARRIRKVQEEIKELKQWLGSESHS